MAYTDPTESIYRIVGEYLQPYSATIAVPYNISNLKNSGSIFYNDQKNIHSKSAENFIKPYEVIFTSGRRNINVSRAAYPLTQSISRVKLNGQSAYTMPARTRNENVIAVIFSAPGGSDVDANGQRDIEGEEYSSNNGMNLRNYSARKQLDDDARTIKTASAPTLHGTNRNTRYRIGSASLTFETRSDNGFIAQMIPFHADQVAWVSQSFMKNNTQKRSHYIYFNEQTGSEYSFTSSMTGSELSKSWGSNYFAIYGYPTWLQTRAGENWRHKAILKRSYLYVNRNENAQEGKGTRRDEWGVIGSGTFDTSSEGLLMFKEPIIDYSNELSFIRAKDPNDHMSIIKSPIYKNYFHNEELNNIYGITVPTSKEDKLRSFGGTEDFTYYFGKKYQIYPPPKVAGLNRTRQRENFVFTAWRDDSFRSQSQIYGGAVPNADNTRQVTDPAYAGYTLSSLYAFNLTGSIWPLDQYVHPTMYTTGGKYVQGELMMTLGQPELYQGIHTSQRSYLPVVSYRYTIEAVPFEYILPWVAYRAANSVPFKDSESVFSLHTSKKYKNYGIVPEFNVSERITSATYTQLAKHLTDNSFVFTNTGSYDVNKLTDTYNVKDKLQFNINAVVQLRPYKNFYPCQYTLECAKQFSSSLSKVAEYNTMRNPLVGSGNALTFAMYPFYNPGVLYSSIKAGLPVSFNFNSALTSSDAASFEDIFDPTRFLNGYVYQSLPSTVITFTESIGLELYKNVVSNFLQEVRYTFCKNHDLEYFESANEIDYKVFTSGTAYVLDIVLETGKLDFSSSNVSQFGKAIIGGVNYLGSQHNLFASNIAPWWPGNETSETSMGVKLVRVSFTPTLTRKYTLDEIFSLATITFHRRLTDVASVPQSYTKLTSSFDLFEKVTDATGNSKWKMKSKWEFPFLALTGSLDHFSNTISTRPIGATWTDATVEYGGGLWHDFCEVPSADQGIFLTLKDQNYITGSTIVNSASLAKQVGFESNKRKRVGELNTQKEISELLCIVPINKQDDSFFIIDVPITAKSKRSGKFETEEIVSKEISVTYETNMDLCKKYIVPPKLDYTIKGNKPVLMFCTEVSDIWSKRDLSYIWQNLLPQNGLSHREQSLVYDVTDQKDLDMLKNKDVYFMVFKCKQRSVSNPQGTYGYNWPYDMCSLLELCQIEMVTEGR